MRRFFAPAFEGVYQALGALRTDDRGNHDQLRHPGRGRVLHVDALFERRRA